ncbi:MAG: hypothetical protein K2W96_18870, partial [Gemmataceae bacterium]|nr:hypothetical protein [Gemmataceae bacterium]
LRPGLGSLGGTVAALLGQGAAEVEARLAAFRQAHPPSAAQERFLGMIGNHLRLHGALAPELLWEEPFTRLHGEGASGLFAGAALEALVALVRSFGEEAA